MLGSKVSADIVMGGTDALEKAVAWDSKKRLEFVLPFQDMKSSLFLGENLIRVRTSKYTK